MTRLSALLGIALAGLSAGVLLSASQARAYCRTTTAKQTAESSACPGVCITSGVPLYWTQAETQYAFNVRPFKGFNDADARRIIGDSFAAWTAVDCPVQTDAGIARVSVGLQASAKSGTTTDEVGPKESEPNNNAIVFFTGAEWVARNYDERAFALTSLWYYDTGEIIGADMHFNGAMNFGECPADGCGNSALITDLGNVATHEAGHYFGLAHSQRESATMWCDASPGQVDKRTLSPDDIEGLCAIYPPGESFMSPPTSPRREESGCSVTAARSKSGLGVFWILLAGLALLGVRRMSNVKAAA